jgi:ribosomal protein S18 acetylase RimI-like enzyme
MLHDLVVELTRRRKGVGQQLLAAMIDALAARGAPRLVLSTAAQNAAAQRLFASAGFRQTMIEMTRELS